MPRLPPAPRPARPGTLPLAVAAVAAAGLAALMLWVAARGGGPFPVDRDALRWALDHRTPGGEDVFTVITHSGSGAPPLAAAAVAGALAVGSPRWRAWLPGAAAGAIALLTGQALRWGLVSLLDRPRPPAAVMALHAHGPAMPSGHTATSALAAAGLAAALLARCRSRRARVLAVALPAVWALAVGYSRVYLGVHWATDVLAGWLFATALACLALPPLAALTRRFACADGADGADGAPRPWSGAAGPP
ncbi:phosphatase PAP2 family protein [Streptomyces sp. 7-21]|uniref:phosphatase PAP2 family protein n=1 Tax=Streptomyces sp. 7-21 TaxID=2802283 RepID=UPI00191CA1AB|nr:phosphatase PAP2 family protein [Streptomyces sp. 7-21]MBL1066026.1 phosphatase PAP2 family protein [Streptomyces sp. 7-21]